MNQVPIRVLVVDDSAVVRGLLVRTLESESDLDVIGTAMNGKLALSLLAHKPADVMVLDVEMPVMDGLETLKHVQRLHPELRVIMASTLTSRGAETTVRALSLGAAACVAKPSASSINESIRQLRSELVPLIRAVGRAQTIAPTAAPAEGLRPTRNASSAAVQVIVIGASTGGPQALNTVLTGLPADFPIPVFIVQHMPPHFTSMLARHIAADTGREACEAQDGQVVERGHTYVAPGDWHMLVDKREDRMVLRLNQEPRQHYCRPSVNPLFRSAAEWYGKSLLGVILTGMGEDGIEGARALAERESRLIVQDRETSVVWGMPGAAAREGLATEILPLREIAPTILNLCGCRASAP